MTPQEQEGYIPSLETPDEMADVWAIVELMGHVRLAGKLTEEEKFGSKLGRLDIPDGAGYITQFFGGGSVYRITVVTEAVARETSKRTTPAPVSPWNYPKQIAATPSHVFDCGHTPEDCDCEDPDGEDDEP